MSYFSIIANGGKKKESPKDKPKKDNKNLENVIKKKNKKLQ